MNLDNILDELQQIREQNDRILEILSARTTVNNPKPRKTTTAEPRLDPEIAADIEAHIVPEWWFEKYGEALLPAKYMDTEGFGFSPEEEAFLQACMRDLTQRPPLVNGGRHSFEFVGKKYCKAEKNTVACYACVPVNIDS